MGPNHVPDSADSLNFLGLKQLWVKSDSFKRKKNSTRPSHFSSNMADGGTVWSSLWGRHIYRRSMQASSLCNYEEVEDLYFTTGNLNGFKATWRDNFGPLLAYVSLQKCIQQPICTCWQINRRCPIENLCFTIPLLIFKTLTSHAFICSFCHSSWIFPSEHTLLLYTLSLIHRKHNILYS